MSSFFQLFMAWGLLLVFVLVLYMVDKVNVIYQGYAKPDIPKTYNDGLFGELTGIFDFILERGFGINVKLQLRLKTYF